MHTRSQLAKEFVQFSKADNHVGFFDLIILRLILIDKPMLGVTRYLSRQFKGTVSRNVLLHVYLMNQLPPSP